MMDFVYNYYYLVFSLYLTINEKRNWYDIKYKHNLLYT